MDRREDEKSEADDRFDASQYAFFGGKGVGHEVELGGLDDDDGELGHLNEFDDDDEFSTSAAREEAGGFSELGDDEDLTSSFLKLSATDNEDDYLGKSAHDLPADIAWDPIELERKQWQLKQSQQDLELLRPSSSSGPLPPHEWWSNNPPPPFNIHKPPNPGRPMIQPMMPHGTWPQTSTPGPLMPPPQLMHHQRPPGFFMPHIMPHGIPPGLDSRPGSASTPPRRNPEPGASNTPMRSKYMSSEEIETIARIQWAATHANDPYIDDYYHQAMRAKSPDGGGTPYGRRRFAPSHLRELPPHARTAAEPHAFLQVDALGRIPFSSIRRPRPLLDVDGVNEKRAEGSTPPERRLEQEPMLAARIAVEDGLCLLLDVDDIDRMLAVTQMPDGGIQLRRRRQMLLEGLAASLQLVDPLHHQGSEANGRVSGRDDVVFLRLASLPKGRKLLSRYLRLLTPGTELVRVVLMAIFRHLRFLFGGVQPEPSSSMGLVSAVVATIRDIDLAALSACLAAVVLAAEPAPLRPVGSISGDGATVVLQAVLERATGILSDPRSFSPHHQQHPHFHHHSSELWQASFDAFFGLLAKYCSNKYESIMHGLTMAGVSSGASAAAAISAAAAAAMAKEMPMELLRASLPHTNEEQRRRLLEFAQRSIVHHASGGVGGESGRVNVVRG